jgi:uncharacterized membrane protein
VDEQGDGEERGERKMIEGILIIIGTVLIGSTVVIVADDDYKHITRVICLVILLMGILSLLIGISITSNNNKENYYKLGNIDGMKGIYHYQLQEIDSNNFEDYIKKGEK